MELSGHIKKAGWKTEKHVPVLDCLDEVKAGKMFGVKVTLGKEIAHPNSSRLRRPFEFAKIV